MSLPIGTKILWRYRNSESKSYTESWIIETHRNFVELGPWNGSVHGVWVKLGDIEYEVWR